LVGLSIYTARPTIRASRAGRALLDSLLLGGDWRMRMAVLALLIGCATAVSAAEPYHLIPGAVPLDAGPDGNTIVLDGPKGLIVFDTGRHTDHAQAILDYAKQRGRQIAAIVNSHWHLDHTTGNWDIRQAYPHVAVYASNAMEGALQTFLKDSRAQTDALLADPKTDKATRDQLERAITVTDHPKRIRPDHIVARSRRMTIAGRPLEVHLARLAATEGDIWVYDERSRTVLSGDLVVGLVPFMDTACAEGWSKALDEIAKVPFTTLIPGHGDPMTRDDFLQWRTAYNNFVSCGRSTTAEKGCIQGWLHDAAKFIPADHRGYVGGAAGYYIETRLRSSPEEQQRYCRPLSAATWHKQTS
jgi:glyoxylase-like metal-dependent hydrolase (beta-lactamase superfamily II)